MALLPDRFAMSAVETTSPQSALNCLLRLAGALPLGFLRAIGAALGWLVYLGSPAYRRRLLGNLSQAGYGQDPGIRRQAIAEAGRMVAELPWIWARTPAEILPWVRCDASALLEQVRAERRGILFMTPHLGGFEMAARFWAAQGPITVLFRPPKQGWLARFVLAARSCAGLRAVPVGASGLRALLRALRAGDAVGLLPDQVPGRGTGVWVPFFGRSAFTMTLPQRLVEQTGAAVVLATGERLPGGRGWRLHLEPMPEPPTPERLNHRLEELVARFPAQYLWAYNRYKQPAGASAPPTVDG